MALGSFFLLPTRRPKVNLVEGLCQGLIVDIVHWNEQGLVHQLGQPRGLSGFIYKVVTRQKLKLTNGFEFHSCCLLQLCLTPTATRLKKSVSYGF